MTKQKIREKEGRQGRKKVGETKEPVRILAITNRSRHLHPCSPCPHWNGEGGLRKNLTGFQLNEVHHEHSFPRRSRSRKHPVLPFDPTLTSITFRSERVSPISSLKTHTDSTSWVGRQACLGTISFRRDAVTPLGKRGHRGAPSRQKISLIISA